MQTAEGLVVDDVHGLASVADADLVVLPSWPTTSHRQARHPCRSSARPTAAELVSGDSSSYRVREGSYRESHQLWAGGAQSWERAAG